MSLAIEQFICRSDNFGILVHDRKSGQTLLIDAPEEAAINAAVERTGWKPTLLLTTHHHFDHVDANLAMKKRYGVKIIGPKAEKDKIPGIDRAVSDGDTIDFVGHPIKVISTPGHTAGHVSFHFTKDAIAFTGDTLFALGCGRLFECKPPVMLDSLKKLARLPLETTIYCGHEYTLSNAEFALSVDPNNSALVDRVKAIRALRNANEATLPTRMVDEMATNPFMRWHDKGLRENLGLDDASDEDVFAELRKRKDLF